MTKKYDGFIQIEFGHFRVYVPPLQRQKSISTAKIFSLASIFSSAGVFSQFFFAIFLG
jgi:hypothetical protein